MRGLSGQVGQTRPLRRSRGDVVADITGTKAKGEYRLPLSEVILADKDGRRMDTYTHSERKAMVAELKGGCGVIAAAYLDTREDKHTDVSLVDLAQFSYSEDNVTGSRLSTSGLHIVNLWQARLGFPHPELMAKILKGTTGHNIDPEKARTLARRTLISTLAHQERHRCKRDGETPPGSTKGGLGNQLFTLKP
jgi:hypothetical protein